MNDHSEHDEIHAQISAEGEFVNEADAGADVPLEDTKAQRITKIAIAFFLLFLLVGWYLLLLLG
jgi:hypothetical protein